MRTADQVKEACCLYLELRAFGGSIKTRPHPGTPTGYQLGIFGLKSLPSERRHALRECIVNPQMEMISLVMIPGGPDARAVLEEGTT